MSKRKRDEREEELVCHDDDNNQILCDDVLVEIFAFINDFNFVVINCSLVCKQWLNAILLSERLKLYLNYSSNMKPQGRFLSKIATLVFESKNVHELFNTISLMPQLTSLNLGDNFTINLEGIKHISELKQLTHLTINNCNTGVLGAKFISTMKLLTKLSIFGYKKIDLEGAKYISELKQLTTLSVTKCNIKVEGVKLISTELKQLTKLKIGLNQIGSEGAKYISELDKLTNLTVSGCNIKVQGAKHIGTMRQLTKLKIGRNEISSEGVKYISELKQLTNLDINQNDIGSKGFEYICGELKQLIHLNVYNCRINNRFSFEQFIQLSARDYNNMGEGAKYIANMKQLTSLQIGNNFIHSEQVKYISEYLEMLTNLDISGNNIGNEGAKLIGSRMKQLKHLNISDNQIDSIVGKRIIDTLSDTFVVWSEYNGINNEE